MPSIQCSSGRLCDPDQDKQIIKDKWININARFKDASLFKFSLKIAWAEVGKCVILYMCPDLSSWPVNQRALLQLWFEMLNQPTGCWYGLTQNGRRLSDQGATVSFWGPDLIFTSIIHSSDFSFFFVKGEKSMIGRRSVTVSDWDFCLGSPFSYPCLMVSISISRLCSAWSGMIISQNRANTSARPEMTISQQWLCQQNACILNGKGRKRKGDIC